jgi:hypothetical protein
MASIPVQIKRSSEAGRSPLSSDLLVGELAINFPDKKLYTKNSTNQVILVGNNIFPYDSDSIWSLNDLVVYEDNIYAANTDKVGNGAPFTVAVGGNNTWRRIGKDDEINVINIQSDTATAFGTGTADLAYGTGTRPTFTSADIIFTNGMTVPSSGRVSVSTDGTYKISTMVTVLDNGGTATTIFGQIGVNGTGVGMTHRATASVSAGSTLPIEYVGNLNAGDIIDVRYFSGATAESLSMNSFNMTVEQIAKRLPGLNAKVLTEPLVIGAVTTAPTKATTRQHDYITIKDDETGWCDINFEYSALSPTGAASGNGIYLFSLPTGYQFDTTIHPLDNLIIEMTYDRIARFIPGSSGLVSVNNSTSTAIMIPYDSSRFKIVTASQLAGTGHLGLITLKNTYYHLNNSNCVIQGAFRFKKA